MPLHSSILASGDDAIVKVIFGAIFFVIWAISAAVSSVAKKQQEARRRQMTGQPPLPVPQRIAPSPAAPGVFGGPMTRVLNAPPPRQTAKSQKRPPKPQKVKPQIRRPAVAAPPPVAAAQQRSAMQAPPAPTTHLAGGSAGSTTVIGGARAAAHPLTRLMNPKTLRTLVITNELLQPPVALRDQWPPLG